VAAAGNDRALHVVRGEPHRVRCPFTDALRPADRQHRQGQPPGLALLVLRDGRVKRAVGREAAVQGFGIGSEGLDVVPDGVIGQFVRGLGELEPEVDVFPSGDELFVYLGQPVEGEVPQPVVGLPAAEQRRRGDTPGIAASATASRSTRSG
jgi:hypothetical protein